MKRRIVVRGVIVRDGELFCVRHTNYRTSKPVDYWCTPGGGIDEGENLQAAVEREMIEETGVKPVVGALLYIQQYADETEEQLEFFFHITNADDYNNIDLAKTSHGQKEISEFRFIKPDSVKLLPQFLQKVDFTQDIAQAKTQIFSYL